MPDRVLITRCLPCGSITAAALIRHDSDPLSIGRMIIAATIDDKVALVVDGPVEVSACCCPSRDRPVGMELLKLRDKVAELERQLSNEAWRRERAEAKMPATLVNELIRTAEIMGETITVDQLRDAIEGHTRPLGASR